MVADFFGAAWFYIAMGVGIAIACANAEKLTLLLKKWSGAKN